MILETLNLIGCSEEDADILKASISAISKRSSATVVSGAAKIFMDATSNFLCFFTQTVKNQKNNFIQINGVTITAEQVDGTAQRKAVTSLRDH